MEQKLNNYFYELRNTTFNMIREKNVDIDLLASELGIDRQTFIDNFTGRIDDFSFYLKTIELLDSWMEG